MPSESFTFPPRVAHASADNMMAWLRKGCLDLDGRLVNEDRFVPDNVV